MKILSAQTIRKRLRAYYNIDISLNIIHQLASDLGYSKHFVGQKRGYESSLYTQLTRNIPSLIEKDKEFKRQRAEELAKKRKNDKKDDKKRKNDKKDDKKRNDDKKDDKKNSPVDDYYTYNGENDRVDYDWEKNESIVKRHLTEAINELELYHGTTADFNHFDLAFISSGWGQQAYGYGVYLTDYIQSAIEYSMKGYVYVCEVPKGKYLRNNSISRAEARNIAIKFFKYYTTEDEYGKDAYKDNEQEFWDEECKYVASCETGADIYGTISSLIGSDKKTSEFLHRLGYKGLRYNTKGGLGNKFKIYIIFDPRDIQIITKKKYNEI